MKKNKWYLNNLYRAISVAQWCVLVCAFLTFLTGPEQLWLAIAETVLFLVLILLNVLERKRRDLDVKEYVQTLNDHMDTATKDSLVNFPFPMVVAHLDGRVSWYNQSFAKIISGESLFERHISDIIDGPQLERRFADAGGDIAHGGLPAASVQRHGQHY